MFFFLLTSSITLYSQSLDFLKTGSVDNMSDQQLESVMQKMQSEGIQMNQIDQYGSAQGIKKEEIAKFKKRVVRFSNNRGGVKLRRPVDKNDEEETDKNNTGQKEPVRDSSAIEKRIKIFGSDIFKNINLNFEPNLRMATPTDYVLGPDDELLIDIYGVSESSYKVNVTPEGKIKIPVAGMINVGGLTIEEARKVIKRKLGSIYGGISSNSTQVSITLGDIRSITVHIIGEVIYPGSYSIPSLSTVFNALYQSGGPKTNGSYREIQVIRGNKLLSVFDLYDYLVKGKMNNVRLQDQDVIKVMPYHNRVTLLGEVKNEAIFEMRKGETLGDLIQFAGGFNETAYRDRITVLRNTLKEKSVADVAYDQINQFKAEAGDQFTIGKILNRYTNRIQISGAVYRPGVYALAEKMTLRDLLIKSDGLKEDAYTERGVIFRKEVNGQPAMTNFCPSDILSGKEIIELQKEDSVIINSLTDLKEKQYVHLSGEVINPDKYEYAKGMTLKDLIFLSKGFKNIADYNDVEVFRQIRDEKTLIKNVQKAKAFKIRVSRSLSTTDSSAHFRLEPEDRIVVRPQYGYEDAKEVKIEGEVYAAGSYIMTSKNERISDLVKAAGGVTRYAYPEGAFLIRRLTKSESEKEMMQKVTKDLSKKIKKKTVQSDTTEIEEAVVAETDIVGINMEKILKRPGSKYDIKLEPGDLLQIPRVLETVKVNGEVLRSGTVRYDRGRSFNEYVSLSGGYSAKALAGKAYVIHANGSVNVTRSYLGFRIYPRVRPGSQIIVPQKNERKGMTTAETISISTSVVSLAAIIVTLFR